jgi:hypothetical protein
MCCTAARRLADLVVVAADEEIAALPVAGAGSSPQAAASP